MKKDPCWSSAYMAMQKDKEMERQKEREQQARDHQGGQGDHGKDGHNGDHDKKPNDAQGGPKPGDDATKKPFLIKAGGNDRKGTPTKAQIEIAGGDPAKLAALGLTATGAPMSGGVPQTGSQSGGDPGMSPEQQHIKQLEETITKMSQDI